MAHPRGRGADHSGSEPGSGFEFGRLNRPGPRQQRPRGLPPLGHHGSSRAAGGHEVGDAAEPERGPRGRVEQAGGGGPGSSGGGGGSSVPSEPRGGHGRELPTALRAAQRRLPDHGWWSKPWLPGAVSILHNGTPPGWPWVASIPGPLPRLPWPPPPPPAAEAAAGSSGDAGPSGSGMGRCDGRLRPGRTGGATPPAGSWRPPERLPPLRRWSKSLFVPLLRGEA